ncbi:MAG: Wadjet anti-phage system protein JetD domain-containing protein, partial [Gammaproteobacteria bacterium]
LPLKEVDTKFLENNLTLISDLLDAHFDGEISRANGLVNWLGCLDLPKAWLMVRPLCRHTRQNLCGLPILQLSAQTLRETTLPAGNILVVENNQSGYGLPALDDTIAVFGGGANVSWLDAEWLHGKNVAYWGDIDTWGFSILSDARRYLSDLKALMMDKQTFIKFRQRAIEEPSPVEQLPPNLFAEEIELFDALQQGDYRHSRLEQERLSSDYIANQLLSWVS